jgi:hypothetical protein
MVGQVPYYLPYILGIGKVPGKVLNTLGIQKLVLICMIENVYLAQLFGIKS